MSQEQTLVLIKPDGVAKALTGNIITQLSTTGLNIVGTKIVPVSKELAEEHYKALKEKDFFGELIDYIMGKFHVNKVMALIYQGDNAVERIREAIGATHPEKADPTSIRGKFGRITEEGVFENVVHASESVEEAEREIKLWFKPEDLIDTIYKTEEKEVTEKQVLWK